MGDGYSSMAERRLALVRLLADRETLTIPEMQAGLGTHRFAVVAALAHAWFERRTAGRSSRYGLSAVGRAKADLLAADATPPGDEPA